MGLYVDADQTPKKERTLPASRAGRLRDLLFSSRITLPMEARAEVSTRIVDDVGVEGIRASDLSVSTSLGLRDRNEASWTQVLDVLDDKADIASVPRLLMGDAGHGDVDGVRLPVGTLTQREIAVVCPEDKLFPEVDSLIGVRQPLAPIIEAADKIKAAVDSRLDDGFCIVARVEAPVAGRGLDETLSRAPSGGRVHGEPGQPRAARRGRRLAARDEGRAQGPLDGEGGKFDRELGEGLRAGRRRRDRRRRGEASAGEGGEAMITQGGFIR